MISNFFIDRPIFATVLSIIITFVGLIAIKNLPVEQYPNITPPLIQVTATYNGANANVMADDVASPLEQQILGVENMLYMYSQNSVNGTTVLSVYFAIDSDPNIDQVNVLNRINQAKSQLPPEVQLEGLVIQKQTPNVLLAIALQSPEGVYDQKFISNYASINVVNELDLLPGISTVSMIGAREYSMRIWLRPDMLAELGITTSDIVRAIQEQNADFGIGQMGSAPNTQPVSLTVPMATQGRLSTAEQFENIILRADLNGQTVLLKDVGRVELGAEDYGVDVTLDGHPITLIPVFLEYGANALQVAGSIYETMERLSKNFPKGITYSIPYNTTLYVKTSIQDVLETIAIATLLVALVVFIFLQKWRATLIPLIAMVVSIIGTFAGLWFFGFSINMLSLFGVVLAIGIVVDDAIVVVENVERNLRTGLTPKEAARQAMDEVANPIIAIIFVLCAVFVPVIFLGGVAGKLYEQFALTIAISVSISGFIALTLSPALAALLLKPHEKEPEWAQWFNEKLSNIVAKYVKLTFSFLHRIKLAIGIFVTILLILFLFFKMTPTSLVPNEDQGYLFIFANLPDGASLDRTKEVSQMIEKIVLKHPGVRDVISLSGFSLIDNLARTTVSSIFVNLKDWKYRRNKKLHADAIQKELTEALFSVQEANIVVASPPAIQGLGTVSGFEFWIENRGDGGMNDLEQAVNRFIDEAKKRPEIANIYTTAEFNNLQFYVDLDRYKAMALGVSISEVFQALQTLLGSLYVNNFNKFGRVYQVIVQAEPAYRERLSNLGEIYVRSSLGEMVPLSSLITISYRRGPNLVSRFNDFPAAEIFGAAAPGYTSFEAISAMKEVAQNLDPNIGYGWSGQAYEELASGGTSYVVLLGGLFMVFLILAALYERWNLPLAILMAIPFGLFGAFIGIWIRNIPNDIYFQIGMITLMALSAKNAILIIEFAHQNKQKGLATIPAVLKAAKLRFRPIIMTSFAFIFGVTPLVFSQGAGAASKHSMGTGIFTGMIFATFFSLFFVPVFFKILSGKSDEKH